MIYDSIYGAAPWVSAELLGVDYAVVIIGAGPAGMFSYHELMCSGVRDIAVIDKSPNKVLGSWSGNSYNEYLRSPKSVSGWEGPFPELSVEGFIKSHHGEEYWLHIENISPLDWIEYIAWFRDKIGLVPVYNTEVCDIDVGEINIVVGVRNDTRKKYISCICVVVATGMAGYGGWLIPDKLKEVVPAGQLIHANSVEVGKAIFRGRSVAILGAGVSAFDAAVVAMNSGARNVDIFYRMKIIPNKETYRDMEKACFLEYYCALSDENKILIARSAFVNYTPPANHDFKKACRFKEISLNCGVV